MLQGLGLTRSRADLGTCLSAPGASLHKGSACGPTTREGGAVYRRLAKMGVAQILLNANQEGRR